MNVSLFLIVFHITTRFILSQVAGGYILIRLVGLERPHLADTTAHRRPHGKEFSQLLFGNAGFGRLLNVKPDAWFALGVDCPEHRAQDLVLDQHGAFF